MDKRGILYIRKSTDQEGFGPENQLEWALAEAKKLGVTLNISLDTLNIMIQGRQHHDGDLYLDFGISGAVRERPGLMALMERATKDKTLSHVFVYHRDRLSRLENVVEAMKLEDTLRRSGKYVVYHDGAIGPLQRGSADLSEVILSAVSFDQSAKKLRELADRVIRANTKLSRDGYWAGGIPLYGFGRYLVGPDKKIVRELQPYEHVRQEGHHVLILPKDQEKIKVLKNIMELAAEGWGIKRIANHLNKMGVPSPNAGRERRDKFGHLHLVSGKWSPGTIRDIIANPILIGQLIWARRSEGRHLRVGASGPRELEKLDLTESGNPKVISNQNAICSTAVPSFDPQVAPELFERIQKKFESKGASQRGKTRSPDPYRYPLNGRIFDASPNCGWPLYGKITDGIPRYACGQYMTTGGAACNHNAINADAVTHLGLAAIKTEILRRGLGARLREKLEAIAKAELAVDSTEAKRKELVDKIRAMEGDLSRITQSLAMETVPERREAIGVVWDEKNASLKILRAELESFIQGQQVQSQPVDVQVDQAMGLLEDLDRLTSSASGPELKRLFGVLDLRVWLYFKKVLQGKRTINKVAHGVLTSGNAPWPITPYNGPRGVPSAASTADKNEGPAGAGPDSLQKVHRGERI